MKLNTLFFIPALLLSGVFNTFAGETENIIASEYVTHWNEVMNGQSTSILRTAALAPEIVKNCQNEAPKQFRNEIILQWEHKTGTRMTQNAFLSEDLQLFDRLATLSCLEGADYEHKGYGELLVKSLSDQLRDMDIKDGEDAYEQTKTMQFQTGIMTAKYGMSLEKNRLAGGI